MGKRTKEQEPPRFVRGAQPGLQPVDVRQRPQPAAPAVETNDQGKPESGASAAPAKTPVADAQGLAEGKQ